MNPDLLSDPRLRADVSPPDVPALIRASFPLVRIPSVPEIRLHQADPNSGLWRLAELGGQSFDTPYWAYPWGGGLALARFVLDHPELIDGHRVLDLGAGSGIVGIAAAKSGARDVTAVDIDRYAVTAAQLNAAANGVRLSTRHGDIIDEPPPAVDVILVGDLFYDENLARRVTAFAHRCAEHRIDVLIGDPYRAFLPRSQLRVLAEYSVPDFGTGKVPMPSAVFCFKS